MPRSGSLALPLALGWALLGCATARAPGPAAPPPEPPSAASTIQHPDAPSKRRGVIVPSDVAMPGSAAPVPAITETASPAAGPPSGGN